MVSSQRNTKADLLLPTQRPECVRERQRGVNCSDSTVQDAFGTSLALAVTQLRVRARIFNAIEENTEES
jgi:hypothetical protein